MARGGSSRLIAIIIAVVLAIVATVALVSYIRGVETRTQEEVEPVDAFVAAELIPAGTTAEAAAAAGLIEQRAVPRSAVPDGAITSLAQIEGTVAVTDIQPGEIILQARFGEGVVGARGLRPIPDDMQAISVDVGVVPGVAGFITPGSFVNMMVQLAVPVGEEDEETGETPEELRVQFIIQNTEVLAVGRRVIQEGEETVQQTENILLTLAVTAEDAERVAFAALNGQLYFTLLPEELDAPFDTPGRTFENIFE